MGDAVGGKPTEPPRFPVGTAVLVRTNVGWKQGRVTQHRWRHPDMPVGFYAPYQVVLEEDEILIFVPKDDDKCCKLHVSIWWEDLLGKGKVDGEVIRETLAKEGAQPVDKANHKGRTALLEACERGWTEIAVALLSCKANPNVEDTSGRRPLHLAVTCCREDGVEAALVHLLLAHKADPDAQDRDLDKAPDMNSRSFKERDRHRTALHYCAVHGSGDAAASLLRAAANPNVIDGQYKTPLHLAIDEDVQEMVSLLLEGRADPDMGNMEIGMTSSYLHLAARNGDEELARKLIGARANVDIVGKQGMTPLHMAVRTRKEGIVKLLWAAGCDAGIRAMGMTAAELAVKNGAKGVAELLTTGGLDLGHLAAPAAGGD